ncbi:hypothetical protein AB0K89_13415 [Streptomyces cinnamoneus]|uniref:hypothetical protein n=1 Tax=Streptomyces cinnamoneus TaxID=53446 RepID=UPI0034426911
MEGELPGECRHCRHRFPWRSVINSIRRAIAAAAAGVLLSLAGVAVAAPAHADGPVQSIVCGAIADVSDQFVPPVCDN